MNIKELIWAGDTFNNSNYNVAFDAAVKDPRWILARTKPQELTPSDIKQWLIVFLNKWRCRLEDDFAVPLHDNYLACFWCPAGATPPASMRQSFEILAAVAVKRRKKNGKVYKRTVGPVAAAKSLGLIFPERFCMWDNPVAEAYGFALNGRGYERFLSEMEGLKASLQLEFTRSGYRGNGDLDSRLEKRYGTGRTTFKLLDEYNWLVYTNKKKPPATLPEVDL